MLHLDPTCMYIAVLTLCVPSEHAQKPAAWLCMLRGCESLRYTHNVVESPQSFCLMAEEGRERLFHFLPPKSIDCGVEDLIETEFGSANSS